MFESEEPRGCFAMAGLYGLQFVFSYPLIAIASLPLHPLLALWGMGGDLPGGTTFAGYGALAYLFVGACVGWLAGRLFPSLIPTGRWLWPIPVMVLLCGVVRALAPWPASWFYEYLYATGDNAGLGVFLFTLPTFSAVGYSVGMLIETWARASNADQPISRQLMVSIALGAAFFVSLAAMQTFGSRMVERDLRVRIAVGGPIAADGNEVCRLRLEDASHDVITRSGGITVTASTPAHTIDVESGVRLESMGIFVCKDGQIVHADEPSRSDAAWRDGIMLERVKILDGRNRGQEAWISAFQVWRPL